jgi:hypothetical protein
VHADGLAADALQQAANSHFVTKRVDTPPDQLGRRESHQEQAPDQHHLKHPNATLACTGSMGSMGRARGAWKARGHGRHAQLADM